MFASRATNAPPIWTPTVSMEAPYLQLPSSSACVEIMELGRVGALITRIGVYRQIGYRKSIDFDFSSIKIVSGSPTLDIHPF